MESKDELHQTFTSSPLGEDAARIVTEILENEIYEVDGVPMWGTNEQDAIERNLPATCESVAREAIESIRIAMDWQTLPGMRDLLRATQEIARAAELDRGEEIHLEDLPSDRIPEWMDTEQFHIWSIQCSRALYGDCVDSLKIGEIWLRYNQTTDHIEDYTLFAREDVNIDDFLSDLGLSLIYEDDSEGEWDNRDLLCSDRKGDVIIIGPLCDLPCFDRTGDGIVITPLRDR